MPPHQTNVTSKTERDAAGQGLDLSFTLAKSAAGDALAAASPNASIAALRDALSEKDAAGPPAALARSILGLLERHWHALQESRRRRRMRASLRDLDERQLMDIGVTPGDIEYIAAHRALERLRDGRTCLWLSRGIA